MTSRLRTFIALLLLALWLPATQHCGLEAAGVMGAVDCPVAANCESCHANSHCASDNCQLVEGTIYKGSLATLKISTPLLLVCFVCLVDFAPEPVTAARISPERTDTPPELTPTWSFLRRTALPARAPDFIA